VIRAKLVLRSKRTENVVPSSQRQRSQMRIAFLDDVPEVPSVPTFAA
jgi:hypothetical protein